MTQPAQLSLTSHRRAKCAKSLVEETVRMHSHVDRLRLLFVTPRYFPYTGGVENHVSEVARRLAQRGVDVTILTTDPKGGLPANEQVGDVKIQRVRAWPAQRDYYFAPGILRVIMHGGWDVVHVQSYHTLVAPMAMLAALRANIPYIVTFHGGGHSSRVRHALRGVQRTLLGPLLARAAQLIAIAHFEIALFGEQLGIPRDRFVFIPNGADLPEVAHLPRQSAHGVLIASIGRLERYKGHHRLIEALPHVLVQQPDARLWIAGTGPYEHELRRMAQKFQVADRVEIRAVPVTDRQTMALELSKAALVVLLSEYETHPIAVLEALALGRPALVADTSGLSELAAQGLARAIPLSSTPQQVGTAVLEQLRQPLVPVKLELPTWDDCAINLLAVYKHVVGRA